MINRTRPLIALLTLFVLLGAGTMAFGQIDPVIGEIFQNGKLVGIIYVPDRPAGQALYSEHWILFKEYVYPNAENGIKTEIVPTTARLYENEADFFKRAPWAAGHRYVHVMSYDTTELPGRCSITLK